METINTIQAIDIKKRALVATLAYLTKGPVDLWPTMQSVKIVEEKNQRYVLVYMANTVNCLTVFRVTGEQLRKIKRLPKSEQEAWGQKNSEL